MKYKIEGADAKTGKSRVLRIEAEDEEQAAIRAHDMGVLVSAIHARPDSTSDRIDMTSDKEFALSDAAPAPARSHTGSSYVAMPIPPSPTPSTSAETRKQVPVSPEYGGLKAASVVLHVLALHGIAVPGAVAVTGFDDMPVANLLRPRLTTVRQSIQDLGATAFETLYAMIGRGPDAAETARGRDIALPTTLILRETCGCSPQTLTRPPRSLGEDTYIRAIA